MIPFLYTFLVGHHYLRRLTRVPLFHAQNRAGFLLAMRCSRPLGGFVRQALHLGAGHGSLPARRFDSFIPVPEILFPLVYDIVSAGVGAFEILRPFSGLEATFSDAVFPVFPVASGFLPLLLVFRVVGWRSLSCRWFYYVFWPRWTPRAKKNPKKTFWLAVTPSFFRSVVSLRGLRLECPPLCCLNESRFSRIPLTVDVCPPSCTSFPDCGRF